MARLTVSTTYEADVWRKRMKRVKAGIESKESLIRELSAACASEPAGAETLPWSARAVYRYLTTFYR